MNKVYSVTCGCGVHDNHQHVLMPWNNPKIVSTTPLIAVGLLEWANVNQLYRMWTEYTAAGQSLWGWVSVQLALWLWLNFYRVITPNEKKAIYGTALGVVMNAAVILTVCYFRYWLHEAR